MEHQDHKRQQVKTCQRLRPAFVIARQAAKARDRGERALHHPSAGQQDEASFGLGQAHYFQAHSVDLCCLGRVLTRVALIDKGECDVVSRHLLHRGGQLSHLSAILLIGRRHMQGQQMPQGIHGQMPFAAFAPFGSILACSMAPFRARWQRSTVNNGGRWLFVAPPSQPQDGSQVVDDGQKSARFEPALRRLLDRCPWRQVMRHHPPLCCGSHEPAHPTLHFPQGVFALRGLFRHQRQVGCHKSPFIIASITGVGLSFHTPSLPKVHNSL